MNTWTGSNYLWNIGIGQTADHGPHKVKSPFDYFAEAERVWDKNTYSNLKPGDILWLNCQLVYHFNREILPNLKVPVVLVILDGDNTFPSDCAVSQEGVHFDTFFPDMFLSNENIIHVFAQNCDYEGINKHKVTKIPIGFDFHTVAYRNGGWQDPQMNPVDQERLVSTIRNESPAIERRSRNAWADFQHSDTTHGGFRRFEQFGEDRRAIFEKLIATGAVNHGPFMKRSDLWRMKANHAFTISPHGNGLDCHRTWEDLTLGCIVIVKTSPLDELYSDLPVVIVDNWDVVNRDNLDIWLDTHIHNKHYNLDKLSNSYWIHKIKEKARPYK